MSTKNNPNDLEKLVNRCALQDSAAFERLYKTTSAQLFAIVLRIVHKQEWAEEVLQEGFINIWNNASQFRGDKGTAMTWMSRIVRNKAIDFIRRKPQREINDDDVIDNMSSSSHGPLETLYSDRSVKLLQNCLDGLDKAQQKALLMVYYQGLTHQQLARVLTKPVGTVKSWIRRSLMRLKRCLEP